jgi:hypothetical protein
MRGRMAGMAQFKRFLLPASLISIGVGFWTLPVLSPEFDAWKGEAGSPLLWYVILTGLALISAGFLVSVVLIVLWLRSGDYRFSLRTLLVVMTVIALGLGWIVWAASNNPFSAYW